MVVGLAKIQADSTSANLRLLSRSSQWQAYSCQRQHRHVFAPNDSRVQDSLEPSVTLRGNGRQAPQEQWRVNRLQDQLG